MGGGLGTTGWALALEGVVGAVFEPGGAGRSRGLGATTRSEPEACHHTIPAVVPMNISAEMSRMRIDEPRSYARMARLFKANETP